MNCQDFEQYMDAYLDGEMSGQEHQEMDIHMGDCDICRSLFSDYKMMYHTLQSLDSIQCPDVVIEEVYRKIEAQEKAVRVSWLTTALGSLIRNPFRMSLAGAALLIIFSLLIIPSHWKLSFQDTHGYSQQEVQQAYTEVKFALAQFNKITSRTQELIKKDILVDGVAKPLHSTMDKALKPIFHGDTL